MNLEQILSDELRTVADETAAPPPPAFAALVRESRVARRREVRRRGTTAVLVAAAVLTAVVLGSRVDGPDAGPSPAPQPTSVPTALPTGAPPAIAFIEGDTLYVGGQAQQGSWTAVSTRGRTSLAHLDDETRNGIGTIALFRHGSLVVAIPHTQQAVLSPAGSRAAWLEQDGSRWFAVVYDLVSDNEQGRVAVDAQDLGHVGKETESWESISAVDDAGVVTWGGVLRSHTWTPGSAPVEWAPAAPGRTSGDFPVADGVVSLSPDGTWGAWMVDHSGEQEQGTSETPDQWTIEAFAQRPGDPASRIQFKLPRNTPPVDIVWETEDNILLQVSDDPTGITWHFLRCAVATRRCEVAPTP
jgi:hypothetical protein